MKSCLYTLTPDRDLVVDHLPGHPGIQVLLGSAHAYKFASILGRVAAERAIHGVSATDPDLGASRLDRPALRDPSVPRSFVI